MTFFAGSLRIIKIDRRSILCAVLVVSTIASFLVGPSIGGVTRTVLIAIELAWFPGDGPLTVLTPAPTRFENRLYAPDQEFSVDIYTIGGIRKDAGIVLVNGIEPAGRRYGPLVELAQVLARTGMTVAVPELRSYSEYSLEPHDVSRLIRTYKFLLENTHVTPERSGFLGFSAGGSLAFIAATDPLIADSVGVVALIGPYSDLERVLSATTTGTYQTETSLSQYLPRPLVWQVTRNTVLHGLLDPEERKVLHQVFRGHYPVPDAMLLPGNSSLSLSDDGQAIFDLFSNRDAGLVPELVSRLPSRSRELLVDLSPVNAIIRFQARLLLMHEGGDPYFPAYESEELNRLIPDQSSLITTSFIEHAVLRTPALTPANLFSFYLPESNKLLTYIHSLLIHTGI